MSLNCKVFGSFVVGSYPSCIDDVIGKEAFCVVYLFV